MKFLLLLFPLSCILSSSAVLTDISDLEGAPEFRSVKLHWKYSKNVPDAFGFIVTYCEDQAWGKYRCKDKVVNQADMTTTQDDNFLHFGTDIEGLRMATNYTIAVNPMHAGISRPRSQRGRALGSHIFIQTKGFHARAINCLTNMSLIEIETGPYFGGKISVEGATDELCSTQGNSKSPQTTYMLKINHQTCGSELMNASVKTFVIVQENLPILTHSTRRFMVVCNYVPETFTVRAGVHLPDYDASPNSLIPVGKDIHEVDPSEYLDSSNSLFNSRVGKQVGRALRLSSDQVEDVLPIQRTLILKKSTVPLPQPSFQTGSNLVQSDNETPELDFLTQSISSSPPENQKWAHIVLMIVLVMSAVVGLSCAVLHFLRNSRQKNRTSFIPPPSEASDVNINEHMEGIEDGSVAGPQSSSMTLTEVDFTPEGDRLFVITPSAVDSNSDSTGHISDVDNLNIIFHNLNHELVIDSEEFLMPEQYGEVPVVAIDPFIYSDYSVNAMSSMNCIPSFIPANNSLSVPINNLENIDGIFDEQNGYYRTEPAVIFTRDFDVPVEYPFYTDYSEHLSPPPDYVTSELSAEIPLSSSDSDSDTLRSSSSFSSDDASSVSAGGISICSSGDDDSSSHDDSQMTKNIQSHDDSSKCLSTASLGGIETNWQLMDGEGSVFPAVSA